MKIQKRHIALASLVVALGTAVYLNWQLSDDTSLLKANNDVKELGQAKYVNTSVTLPMEEQTDSPVEASEKALNEEAKKYFAEQITSRQKTQDSILDAIQEISENIEESDDAKELAVENLQKLQKMLLAQSNIEGILKAKGFSECICFLSETSCTVTVIASELEKQNTLIIKDAVLSQYKIEPEGITIIGV